MKLVTAYIQRFMAEKVTDALREVNVRGVTMLNCEGFGRRMAGGDTRYLDNEVAETGFAPKTKLEIVCLDEEVAGIVQVIRKNARTGHHGEGKIFVAPIERVMDIHGDANGQAVL